MMDTADAAGPVRGTGRGCGISRGCSTGRGCGTNKDTDNKRNDNERNEYYHSLLNRTTEIDKLIDVLKGTEGTQYRKVISPLFCLNRFLNC